MSTAMNAARGPESEQSPSRTCPVCGAHDAGEPDPLGVHRCRGCQVEFRPPLRVPIRRAGVSLTANAGRDGRAIMWIMVAVGVTIGVAITAGDSQAPRNLPPFQLDDPDLRLANFEPDIFEGIYDPFAPIELEHEVHVSVLDDGELYATGLVRNPNGERLSDIIVQVRCLDGNGALLATHAGVVGCPTLLPKEVCAWSVSARVPGATDFVLEARGTRGLLVQWPTLALRGRFDLEGAPVASATQSGSDDLAFDPATGRVSFSVDPGAVLLDSWAAVTSLDGQGRVLAVHHWVGDELQRGGDDVGLSVVVESHEGTQAYEVRVGGDLVIPAVEPAAPPL